MNSTLAFDVANYLSNTVFGMNRYQHMDVIRHKMAFFYTALFLVSQMP